MDAYVIRLKVMPSGPEIESERLLESVKNSIGEGRSVRSSTVEPIAFGLYALVVDVVAPEGDGIVDAVETSVSSAPLVAQYEVVGVSRLSSRVKT